MVVGRMRLLLISRGILAGLIGSAYAEWRAETVPTSGPVTSVEVRSTDTRIAIGANWYRIAPATGTLVPAQAPGFPAVPPGGLSDGRVATSDGAIARAWLADPTDRYRHGVLGDAIEAGSLVIERSDGRIGTVTAGANAVFEDLLPRIATLNGVDRIVVVKSYLQRGSALAVIDAESMKIIAETPPIGHAHAWLNPAGIADFDGDGTTDIALVRQPHVAGLLQLWSWQDQQLKKVAEVPRCFQSLHWLESAWHELDGGFRRRWPSRSGGAKSRSTLASPHRLRATGSRYRPDSAAGPCS